MKPREFLEIRVVQSGEIERFELTDNLLNKKFIDLLNPLLRTLKLKEKDVFLSIKSGKMIGYNHLNLPVKMIIEKFGTKLNLYSETIL